MTAVIAIDPFCPFVCRPSVRHVPVFCPDEWRCGFQHHVEQS